MASSSTVIAALRCQGAVLLGADSQTSDPIAGVRWPTEKLEQLPGGHRCIVGFSGATGKAQQARAAFQKQVLHGNQFKKRELVREAIDRCLQPVYLGIKEAKPIPGSLWDITLWGLAGLWAEDSPQILEFEPGGVSCFHDHFHAIGSGAETAYAVYRTLGGTRLSNLPVPRALMALIRILRTSINVEFMGVSEPLALWIVDERRAYKMSREEMDAQSQAVNEWEERERERLFENLDG